MAEVDCGKGSFVMSRGEPCYCGALDCPHCGDKNYVSPEECNKCSFIDDCEDPGFPHLGCLKLSDWEKNIDEDTLPSWWRP